jgi:hypothetical protein
LKKPGTLFLKNDNLKLGLLLGFILPLIVFIALYFLKFSYYPFGEFFSIFIKENKLITFFGVWSLVANIGLFTFYINTNKYQTAKGVFAVTLAYSILFLLIKLWN